MLVKCLMRTSGDAPGQVLQPLGKVGVTINVRCCCYEVFGFGDRAG